MTKRRKVEVGERVLLAGRHPWAGHAAEVIDRQEMTGVLTVRLDNGIESMAWPTQYRTFEPLR